MNRRSFLASALGVFAAALLGKPEPEGPVTVTRTGCMDPTWGLPPAPEFEQPAGIWGKPTDADTFTIRETDWYTVTAKWDDGCIRLHDSGEDS